MLATTSNGSTSSPARRSVIGMPGVASTSQPWRGSAAANAAPATLRTERSISCCSGVRSACRLISSASGPAAATRSGSAATVLPARPAAYVRVISSHRGR